MIFHNENLTQVWRFYSRLLPNVIRKRNMYIWFTNKYFHTNSLGWQFLWITFTSWVSGCNCSVLQVSEINHWHETHTVSEIRGVWSLHCFLYLPHLMEGSSFEQKTNLLPVPEKQSQNTTRSLYNKYISQTHSNIIYVEVSLRSQSFLCKILHGSFHSLLIHRSIQQIQSSVHSYLVLGIFIGGGIRSRSSELVNELQSPSSLEEWGDDIVAVDCDWEVTWPGWLWPEWIWNCWWPWGWPRPDLVTGGCHLFLSRSSNSRSLVTGFRILSHTPAMADKDKTVTW